MKHVLHTLILTLMVIGSSPVWAFDPAAGKQLVDESCTSCHGTEMYTRQDRKVTTRPGLTKQVRICTQMVGVTWFDDDIDNAAEFLNENFYRFAK